MKTCLERLASQAKEESSTLVDLFSSEEPRNSTVVKQEDMLDGITSQLLENPFRAPSLVVNRGRNKAEKRARRDDMSDRTSSDSDVVSQSSDSESEASRVKRLVRASLPLPSLNAVEVPYVVLDGEPSGSELPDGYFCERVERKYVDRLKRYLSLIRSVDIYKIVESKTEGDH
ncbi:hypothetical protein FHG87_015557 [Trinorchestia longiramus]|nr:hypothetical protein FHG87_015557 [Trinorchestia longiramus]